MLPDDLRCRRRQRDRRPQVSRPPVRLRRLEETSQLAFEPQLSIEPLELEHEVAIQRKPCGRSSLLQLLTELVGHVADRDRLHAQSVTGRASEIKPLSGSSLRRVGVAAATGRRSTHVRAEGPTPLQPGAKPHKH